MLIFSENGFPVTAYGLLGYQTCRSGTDCGNRISYNTNSEFYEGGRLCFALTVSGIAVQGLYVIVTLIRFAKNHKALRGCCVSCFISLVSIAGPILTAVGWGMYWKVVPENFIRSTCVWIDLAGWILGAITCFGIIIYKRWD